MSEQVFYMDTEILDLLGLSGDEFLSLYDSLIDNRVLVETHPETATEGPRYKLAPGGLREFIELSRLNDVYSKGTDSL